MKDIGKLELYFPRVGSLMKDGKRPGHMAQVFSARSAGIQTGKIPRNWAILEMEEPQGEYDKPVVRLTFTYEPVTTIEPVTTMVYQGHRVE